MPDNEGERDLWVDGKTWDEVLDWHDKDDAIFNMHEDIQCLKEGLAGLTIDGDSKMQLSCLGTCKDDYSITNHRGEGDFLFYGKCPHKFGTLLGEISGIRRRDIINHLERRLQQPDMEFKSYSSDTWCKKRANKGEVQYVRIGGVVYERVE